MRRLTTLLPTLLLLTCAPLATAEEIGFVEDFALATDRSQALKQLIPGTEQYYFYHCLHYQNQQQFDRSAEVLAAWIKRYKLTDQARMMQRRQALLTYRDRPDQTLDHIATALKLRFDHQRERIGEKPNLPGRLDPAQISRATLQRRALQRPNLTGFEDSALQWLLEGDLDAARRRALLKRLKRPDLPGLIPVIVADLQERTSGGFGSVPIHHKLLTTQLNELLKARPALRNNAALVQIYVAKLRPGADEDWRNDEDVQRRHFDRLWKFVSTLGPVHNSLKAHVLYHRLDHDRAHGIHDKGRFLAYLRLPRNAAYVSREFMRREESRRYTANLQQKFSDTQLRPVMDDEPLVRSYFLHFFIEEESYEPYLPLVETDYLKQVFAETKAVNGLGNREQWASLLPPATYQALKDRVDLDFDVRNKRTFGRDEPVQLDLHVKNVSQLIVKVFHVNTRNYYRQTLREVNTDISLDGLIPNEQSTLDYSAPPLQRIKRHFEFPKLTKPGVYVVDFIGNGRSSRVVVRKGQPRPLVRVSASGQAVRVVDQQNNVVPDATIWFGGKDYQAAENGEILLPFSTQQAGTRQMVIHRGDESYLARFTGLRESYSLTAGMYVDRETLRTRRQAKLLIRPQLSLNGQPVSLSKLQDVSLTIVSMDRDGVPSSLHAADLELQSDRETVHLFHTPPRLASLHFTLSGSVEVASDGGRKASLSDSQSFAVNGIEATEQIGDTHLSWIDNSYAVSLLGRSGEPLADRAVHVELKHRDFTATVHADLQTDNQGRVQLGGLADILWLRARHQDGKNRQWVLRGEQATLPALVHAVAGEPIELPYVHGDKPLRESLSLIEVRGSRFVADRFGHLKVGGGMLRITNLPPGDYDLRLKRTGESVAVRVAAAEERAGYALGRRRYLQLQEPGLSIADVSVDEESLKINLAQAGPHARVHVIGTRYLPSFSAYDSLGRPPSPQPQIVSLVRRASLYVEGRDIGDEYDYIIRRQYAAKFPGNMLLRPSLLLNPWSLRSTQTGQQDPQSGVEFAPRSDPTESAPKGAVYGGRGDNAAADFATLNWLPRGSAVLANLQPDDKGRVSVPLKNLRGAHHIRVVAVHPRGVVQRSLSLPETAADPLDLRLADGLDPQRHYIQRKKVSVTLKDKEFVLGAIDSAPFETYDSLRNVYSLFETLNRDPQLAEFRFVLDWPSLDDKQRREKYSKYACHELNFFLMHKDPKFFRQVVEPHLASKRDKTFLDQWLLDRDLDAHLGAWRHEQLNITERILLGRRVEADLENSARHVEELTHLLPPDVDRFNYLFNTAVLGAALETSTGANEEAGMVAGRRFSELGDAKQMMDQSLSERNEELRKASQGRGGGRNQLAGERQRIKQHLKELNKLQQQNQQSGGQGQDEQAAKQAKKKGPDDAFGDFFSGKSGETGVDQLYRVLDKTQEWAENNYYHLPIELQNADLVTANPFWNDYAHHRGQGPFVSRHLAEASRNFTECMLALAVLDLPFESPEHETTFEGDTMKIAAAGPLIVFHEEIEPAGDAADNTPILVSQNLFRQGDRYRYENNERLDKYVSDEFLTHTVYGCQIVVTNPASAPQKLDLLVQVPLGAMPVAGGHVTRSLHVQLAPYNTQTVEYLFYFPAVGQYAHFPVHVSKGETLLASAEPRVLNVVESLSRVDRESWAYISQNAEQQVVLDYLRDANLQRTELAKIAFRMGDEEFFTATIGLLGGRHAYNHTLWSYSVKHDTPERIREFLQHEDQFVAQSGPYLDSPLLVIDPVVRKSYQHLDYRPLVNARAHQLGARRRILNGRFHPQYHSLLNILAFRPRLDDDDQMSAVYYLLLQDRVEEGLSRFAQVDAARLETKVQHDYFTVYLCFYTGELQPARDISARYADHPVDRWKKAFDAVAGQLDELETGRAEVADEENRDQQQTQLADQAPSFDFKVASGKVALNFQNTKQLAVNYYLMDIELLFSRNPFVQRFSGQFSHILPNQSQVVDLPDQQRGVAQWELPAELNNKNVLVEITAGGVTKSLPYYSHSMSIQLIERFGQLQVKDDDGKPLSKVYVKAYARMQDGSVKFYKDGYTDLRGRFDYSSLNTNDLERVRQFSLLVLSDGHGAVVREATPPAR